MKVLPNALEQVLQKLGSSYEEAFVFQYLSEHVRVNVIVFIIRLTHTESMGKPCSCAQFIESLLQVT